jgi:glycolate oxidase FAD binding subunit
MTVLSPQSEAELAAIVTDTAKRDGRLAIRGGGTRSRGEMPGQALSTTRLSGITLYEPASLTLSAMAGTPVEEVEAVLAGQGQHLPFEPSDWRMLLGTTGKPTIGGMVATAAAGPRRIQAGSVRDSAIGVRFVDGHGVIIKNGGRVMKNVTGYDLVKLMCGSGGTLGILTEITFKLLPKPQTSATIVLRGLSDLRAIEALSAALGSPYDVSGAAHLPGAEPQTLIRIEGFESSVGYRSRQLARVLSAFAVAEVLDHKQGAKLWHRLRNVEPFAGKQGAVFRVSTRPSAAAKLIETLMASLEIEAFYDWGGGLVWILSRNASHSQSLSAISAALGTQGSVQLVRPTGGPGSRGASFAPQSATLDALNAALRRQFDPRGIFNSGVIGFNAAA